MRSKSSSRQGRLEAGIDFHGHLGPYLVLGLRMGNTAVRMLKPKGLHGLSATVWTPISPPQSCVLDGIQVSSGCTLGKGNIRVRESKRTKARFRSADRTLVIEPTEKVMELLSRISNGSRQLDVQEIAIALNRMPDSGLFICRHN
jgi:formylmethanofuran dehydrogenase subunit E